MNNMEVGACRLSTIFVVTLGRRPIAFVHKFANVHLEGSSVSAFAPHRLAGYGRLGWVNCPVITLQADPSD